ncbi:Ca2+-dependent phosphoinositide-specific phospholipase C [Woodsholea maritima]|uniref:Ca2+-dependent phosphoinositide-specific phospholipase C n=1 Tax=Woodsholea maritima TaxID=240237 RepID=UPI000364FEF2|nr:Ca2+-dependent phosphoinositide-specific phospholipase C [Woodsholea maritima]
MSVILALALASSALQGPALDDQPITVLQSVGTHNSYKFAISAPILAAMQAQAGDEVLALDYAHGSLISQLMAGARQLEIDILNDPEGGRFSDPQGPHLVEAMTGLAASTMPGPGNARAMAQPGLKVLHIPDLDYRSSCPTLRACLEEVKAWSDRHSDHAPILIMLNFKTSGADIPGATEVLPFDEAAFSEFDATLRAVLGRRLITPDDVRQDGLSLRESVLAGGWPSVAAARGKFLVLMDENNATMEAYRANHPSLAGRAAFVNAAPEEDEAAILVMNDPEAQLEDIRARVGEGFIVRTRADAGTWEAREGDYTRWHAALASGAHYISTDYMVPDARFGTDYHVAIADNERVYDAARCNPVTGEAICR